jgi:NDP-sugar pyrophosphorylase family protein
MQTTLVVLAAGLGSRFGGNKQISNVGPHGEILMEYSIHDAIEAGFTQIVFILKKEMVELVRSTIGDKLSSRVRVDYAVQDDTTLPTWYQRPQERVKPFGTVHAVLCAKDVIQGPFATVNADDYYGKEAFVTMHSILTSFESKKDAGMVPYILENTMSENGGVTRAICKIENGQLLYADETKDIQYNEQGKIACARGVLDGKSQVSMNFWGFHPDLLSTMSTYFEDFLRCIPEGDIKAECLLPVMVNDFLKKKMIAVTAKPSYDRWFGITYAQDKELVMQELKTLHQQHIYPENLYE